MSYKVKLGLLKLINLSFLNILFNIIFPDDKNIYKILQVVNLSSYYLLSYVSSILFFIYILSF